MSEFQGWLVFVLICLIYVTRRVCGEAIEAYREVHRPSDDSQEVELRLTEVEDRLDGLEEAYRR